MRIGIASYAYFDRYGVEKGLQRMKAHGYDATDFQGFVRSDSPLYAVNEQELRTSLLQLKALADDAGIEINQAHGHWRWPSMDYTAEQRAERFEWMARALYGCALLGCKNLVIHPLMPYGRYEIDRRVVEEINADFFLRLAEVAKLHDVTVCLENMPFLNHFLARPAELLGFVKQLDHSHIRMCLDTGHCTMFDISPADAVRRIGKEHLRVLHVHDNDGQNDQHRLPFDGVIGWAEFARALQEIDFAGVFSLETCVEKSSPAPDKWEDEEKTLAALAASLAGR